VPNMRRSGDENADEAEEEDSQFGDSDEDARVETYSALEEDEDEEGDEEEEREQSEDD